ncbi:MAG: hypothetical protein ACK4P4_02890 [Allorhizobium sp.]
MLEKIKKLLRSGETSADIRSALAELDIAKLSDDYSAAAARRSALLLSGTDREVLDAEKDVEAARLAIERAEAARSLLEGKLSAAEAREFDEAFERQWREADAEAAALFEFIKAKVVPAAAVIDDALNRLETSDKLRLQVYRRIIENVGFDNAAGRANVPDGAMDRVAKSEILPPWLSGRFAAASRRFF